MSEPKPEPESESGSGAHPWMRDLSDRTQARVKEFGEGPFPRSWEDWPGFGPIAAGALAAAGARTPIQLLGALLMRGVADFYVWLSRNGIPTPRIMCLQLIAWGARHGVAVPD